jgi:putative endonuclease
LIVIPSEARDLELGWWDDKKMDLSSRVPTLREVGTRDLIMAEQRIYYVYMMSNKAGTVLYVGVSNSLMKRVSQHRSGSVPGFTQRYNCSKLVYFESFRDVRNAIAREKEVKGWRRNKKDALVGSQNPRWSDLSESVLGLAPAPKTEWKEIPRFARNDR